MKLKEILDKIEYIDFKGDYDFNVKNITYDSRKTKSDTIFTAIKGFKKDGHEFIENSKKTGCKVFLCEKEPDILDDSSYIIVKNTRKSMTDVSYILKKPDDKLNLYGVTGTNGKTSITYLLKSIYDYKNIKSGIIGTMGAIIGNRKISLNNTTPESTDLHDLLLEMKNNKIGNCFMEVSSHSTELFRVSNLKFKVGIFTNLTEDHLIFHENMENYYQAKKKFFYQCEYSVINIDDHYGDRLFNELVKEGYKVFSYSTQMDSDFYIYNIEINKSGSKFTMRIEGKDYDAFIKTPGKFNIYNTVGAMAAAYIQGIDMQECIEALKVISGVEGRFEFLETTLDCTIVIDFAHTPDGLEKVMETINQFATGRKVVLFGAGGERDKSRRTLMGEVAGKYCDFVMLTSDNPINEDPKEICDEIAKGVEVYHNNYKIIIDREEAVEYLIENYEYNDTILLAGKSTEPYQVIKDKKVPYNERQIALNALRIIEQKEQGGKR